MLDKHNPSVVKFREEVEEQIKTHRDALERPGKSAEQYDIHRGQVKAFRWVLQTITPEEENSFDV